jgi:dsDNA-specific endonuclease/ATPase MutS2
MDEDVYPPQPVEIPITDTLDLHTFSPKEVVELLSVYFEECRRMGIYTVRIIHGKGTGTLKNRVLSYLNRNLIVMNFRDAPPDLGGWGATIVNLIH